MSETMEATTEVSSTVSPFAQTAWTETTPPAETPAGEITRTEEPVTTEKPAAEAAPVSQEPPVEWFKNYGWENEDTAKKEIEELRTKAKPQEFANEESRLAYQYLAEGKEAELYEHLHKKKQVEKYISADVSDEKIAAELVKFNIQADNRDLTPDEVEFLFNKRFSLPKEPVQKDDELEDEFKQRHDDWKMNVSAIKKELTIEAKLAKPKLEKLKSELVLPKIGGNESQELSQEDLQKLEENKNRFIQKVDADFRNFNGFETKYKDEEVEIPVSFSYDEAQKIALKEELKTFEVDKFINERWFAKDGSPKVESIMSDIALLRDKEAVLQKVANEIGAQVAKHYRKVKANISVNGNGSSANMTDTANQVVNPFRETNWSATPVAAN